MKEFSYAFRGNIREQDQEILNRTIAQWENSGLSEPLFKEKIGRFLSVIILALIFSTLLYAIYTADEPYLAFRVKVAQICMPFLILALFYNAIKSFLMKYALKAGDEVFITVDSLKVSSDIGKKILKSEWSQLRRCHFGKDALILLDKSLKIHFLPLRWIDDKDVYKRLTHEVCERYAKGKSDTYLCRTHFYKSSLMSIDFSPEQRDNIQKEYARNFHIMLAGIGTLFVPIILAILCYSLLLKDVAAWAFLFSFILITIPGICYACLYGLRFLNGRTEIKVNISPEGLDIIIGNKFQKFLSWAKVSSVELSDSKIYFKEDKGYVCILPAHHIKFADQPDKYANSIIVMDAIQRWREGASCL